LEELIVDLAIFLSILSALYVWGVMGITFVEYVRKSEDPFFKETRNDRTRS